MSHFDKIKQGAIAAFTALTSVWASCVMSTPAAAQTPPIINCQGRPVTELDFTGPSLISGSALSVGAIYEYTDVAPGINARIEVLAFVAGGSLGTIDNDSGLVNYFQPELIKATNQSSAVDLRFSFVNGLTGQPVELDMAVSSIDVDGNNNNVREYVEFEDKLVGYVLNSTTELDMNVPPGPSAGNRRFEAQNFDVAPGIDPTAEDNIVTVFYTDESVFDFRIGALGSGGQDRFTSLGFDCPNLTTPAVSTTTPEDFGDAPVNNYGNPIHTLVNGVRLGATNNADTGSYNSPVAAGDTGDDGVTVPSFAQGETQILNVSVTGAGGYLQSWFDWNDDGDFFDAGEQVATNVQDTDSDGTISLSVAAPFDAAIRNTIARFRWATAQNVTYQEQADDGEVEDYQFSITVGQRDYSDAPLTGTSYGEAFHAIQSGIQLGADVTAEASAYDTPNADGDTDNGITIPTLTQGQSATLNAAVSGTGGFLQGWIDWNDDGDWNDSGEQIAADIQDGNTDGLISVPVNVPSGAALTQTIARFRWSTTSGLGINTSVSDGEVEDYALTVSPDLSGFTCPSGTVVTAQSGNADTVVVAAVNSTRALGAISPEGTNAAPVSATNNSSSPNLTLELEHLVPEGAPITFSLARNNAGGNSDIDVSSDGSVFATQTIFNGGVEEVLEYITVIAPAGGVQFVRVLRNGGSLRIDGMAYDYACVAPPPPDLQADKSIAVYDPTSAGLYALPGNDVIYTITVSNAGDGDADEDSIELIDILPSEIEFWNGDIDEGGPESFPVSFAQPAGNGMSLTYGSDVRFGTGGTPPANFDACTVIAPDNSYRPDLTYICLNPKGTLSNGTPDPTINLSFRARIK